MNEYEKQNTLTYSPMYTLESLCQEFDGISFYGLEYIVEDFFQAKKINTSLPFVDWFGLYD
jgi:hypothetical protein